MRLFIQKILNSYGYMIRNGKQRSDTLLLFVYWNTTNHVDLYLKLTQF